MSHVDVVVVTQGRESLEEALRSVVEQTVSARIICVVDLPECPDSIARTARRFGATVAITGGVKGAAAARNLGVALADADWIAFLDDDDYWDSERLARGLAATSKNAQHPTLVTSDVIYHFRRGRRARLPRAEMPANPRDGLAVTLTRSRLRSNSGFIQTSCMLMSRSLLRSVTWQEGLPRHQDWDFFVRACLRADSSWAHVHQPLVHVRQGSVNSISAGQDWRSSLAWIEGLRDLDLGRARADFLAMYVLRAGFAGELPALRAGVRAIVAARRFPHLASLVVAVSGILRFRGRTRGA